MPSQFRYDIGRKPGSLDYLLNRYTHSLETPGNFQPAFPLAFQPAFPLAFQPAFPLAF
jgi:hypothetical protein